MKTIYKVGLIMLAWLLPAAAFAQQRTTPGTTESVQQSKDEVYISRMLAPAGLQVYVTETGLISASIDGVGQPNTGSMTIQVDKPSGATVRSAHLFSTTIWFGDIVDGDVSLEGNSIEWDAVAEGASGANMNGRKDVTSIVKPLVDAAPAGLIDLDLMEHRDLDGNILAVIFDDPNVTEQSSIALLFGGQSTTGDSFSLSLANPFDDSTQEIFMSLGISFGFQQGGNQNSLIDVNGSRLTSSAGGQDDCVLLPGSCGNGGLITVGGIGDDPANPDDPFETASTDPRLDDELYTLNDFIDTGDTQIDVFTENPSNDDNIFFAAFVISGSAAIVGEGILLTPTDATNPINTDHTLTARVQDDEGDPVAGRDVDFEILSGPNAGLTGTDVTDGAGEATFTYSSSVVGTDVIVARFIDSQQNVVTSNEATKTWEDDGEEDTTDPVCGPITFVVDGDGTYAILSSAADNVGIASATFTRLTSNLDGYVDDGGLQGPFTQGDTYTTGDPDPATVGLRANVTAFSGRFTFLVTVADAAGNTAVCDPVITDLDGTLPETTALLQAYPNPMRVGNGAAMTVPFRLAEAAAVRVVVYDVLGREVAVLAEDEFSAGSYEVSWPEAAALPAGTYLVRMEAGAYHQTHRVTLVR